MDKNRFNSLQNLDKPKAENILKKRLLKSVSISAAAPVSHNGAQQNAAMNNLRGAATNSMIVTSVQAPQSSVPVAHNLVTHSLAPVKIHANPSQYPIQLSTVHVPVQIPGSTSNINVPVQITGGTSSLPLMANPTSTLPIQVSGTSTLPVQLPMGEAVNMPIQIPAGNNISGLSSLPIIQNSTGQLFQVHMGTNQSTNLDVSQEGTQSGVQVKFTNPVTVSSGPMAGNSLVQVSTTQCNPIQLSIPNSSTGQVIRAGGRPVPQMVYIQTSTGIKAVSSSEIMSQSSVSGNPPQIIVRRPITSTSNILISNVSNKGIAPKIAVNSKSILAANATQPIVIQKPKDKVMVPVTISSAAGKQTIAYVGSVKKSNNPKLGEKQSILIQNNQPNTNINAKQKVFLTPMNSKVQNTKIIMASKGPIINLQIANGQLQNDPRGNITVMRDPNVSESLDMPPLQPLANTANGKENPIVPNTPIKTEKSFTTSIPGSRVEATGEHEYSLSIPETNDASMNDDVYTVSIADGDGGQTKESFTLTIPEKSKSLLNKNLLDKCEQNCAAPPAAANIMKRSNSDYSDRKMLNANLKRRISLCNENVVIKSPKISLLQRSIEKVEDNNEDMRIPSLFCDEKLDKELDAKVIPAEIEVEQKQTTVIKQEFDRSKRESVDSAIDEDPPGLTWNNGVATLTGSNLQFQTNEFGLIDVIDNSDNEGFLLNHTAKYHTPLKQRIDRSGREKKPTSPEDLYRCDGCGCHGMAAEFITPNFCSLTCQSDTQKAMQKKRDRERADLNRKKNKMKRLLLQKNLSESELMQDKEDRVSLQQYNSLPSDGRVSESSVNKLNDDIENEKYPWMCGKNGFSWMRYLEFCKAKAAPVKLFKDPFPYNRNGFKVGMRMEAIDPQCASLFCVVTVAEVQGYRMRLNFDGYSDMYDYWVNADSIDIFPSGWCEKNGRTLQPPGNYTAPHFLWPLYLKQVRGVAAPRHLFAHVSNTQLKPNGFRIGMKLEAEDRKNNMVCAATVADMMEGRLLITFDSWDEMYDFWAEPTSPHIHPVGWAEENDIELTPPNFYKSGRFTWERYLNECGAAAAPARAFRPRHPQGFKPGMKLELVDRRVPFLIRVATVSEVKDYQIRVSFDGWPAAYSYWLDDDCPDLHPVGWCLKTGHPLEPPLTAEELSVVGPCGTAGCRGLGAARGGGGKTHATPAACPYTHADPYDPPPRLTTTAKSIKSTSTPTSDIVREKLPRGRPPKHKKIEEITKTEPVSEEESECSRWNRCTAGLRGRVAAAVAAGRRAPEPDVAAHLARLGLRSDAATWTQGDVYEFASLTAGPAAAACVRAARLDGRGLLMASRGELVARARLRLGPAVKLHAAVRALRTIYTQLRHNKSPTQ